MESPPVSDEVGAALGRFFAGGAGPTHSALTAVFQISGYGDADPYDAVAQQPNKETRVQQVFSAASRRPSRARELTDSLLARLRVSGVFDPESATYDGDTVRAAQRAFRRLGWTLSDEGDLARTGAVNLSTGGRTALDELLDRLRKAMDDPALMLGTAKDLLESVAKFVLEAYGVESRKNADYAELWHLARERLGILPEQVPSNMPGAKHIRQVLQSTWRIAEQVNLLRSDQGTGHGRTLPTGVTPELARLVVREACSVAEFALNTLDRLMGRRVE